MLMAMHRRLKLEQHALPEHCAAPKCHHALFEELRRHDETSAVSTWQVNLRCDEDSRSPLRCLSPKRSCRLRSRSRIATVVGGFASAGFRDHVDAHACDVASARHGRRRGRQSAGRGPGPSTVDRARQADPSTPQSRAVRLVASSLLIDADHVAVADRAVATGVTKGGAAVAHDADIERQRRAVKRAA